LGRFSPPAFYGSSLELGRSVFAEPIRY
jgi:hypothetical protein